MRAILLAICVTLCASFSQPAHIDIAKLKLRSAEARSFCSSKKMNTKVCLLIDLSVHSGRKRAFLWDLEADTLILAGMCSHGCGSNPWAGTYTKDKPLFSNTPDSHCSSTGKYKVGQRGYSQWGINVNYILDGLEASNSNAKKRQIVLHSWDDVPNEEIYPKGTPEGWGCPAVSNVLMRSIDQRFKVEKNCLLWIYN